MDVFYLLWVAALLTLHVISSAPDVPLARGLLKGVDENAVTTQKPYHVYYGVPFAQPPLGSLRFKSPRPFYASGDPDQVINSGSYRKACIQNVRRHSDAQSEDCLYLNVFTPSVGATDVTFNPDNTVKKVMVWIHGGGYIGGDAISYRPSRLVTDFDVIVVTTQYRLGPFGFLSSGDDVLPGNVGLRDQILALKWVKDNIRHFGGDPDDVTLFGESAGGFSVNLLALSPLAEGLFTKAVMQSGTALAPGAMRSNPEELLYHVAKNTECLPIFYVPGFSNSSYHQRIIDCLKRVSARELHDSYADIDLSRALSGGTVDNNNESQLNILNSRQAGSFGPSVDGQVLPRDPASLLADRRYMAQIGALNRTYVIGVTNNEGMLFGQLLSAMGVKLEDLTKEDVFNTALTKSIQSVSPFAVPSEILNFASLIYGYPRDRMGKPQLQGIFDIATDIGYVIPCIKVARALIGLSSQVNVYVYLFDHYPEIRNLNSYFRGTGHSIDLSYLFDEIPDDSDFIAQYANIYTPSSLPLLDIYRGVLSNFAKTGNPSLSGNARWLRYDLQNESYMAISTKPEVRQHMYRRRVSFWTDFLPRVVRAIFSRGPGGGSLTL